MKPARSPRSAAALRLPVALLTLILVGTGWGHRSLLAHIETAMHQVLPPRQPLASLPTQLGDWRGSDVPLDERGLGVANFDDEYVNRVYVNAGSTESVALFVGYVGRPRANLGHRPDVCYAAHGWVQVSEQHFTMTARDNHQVPSILYEFRRPQGFDNPQLVLATYMTNGRYSEDPTARYRYNSRSPLLLGERPAYLARIQIALSSSGDRNLDVATLRDFMAQVAGPVAAIMPYWQE